MVTMTTTSAPPRCDANSTKRAATDWGEPALPCQAHRGLRSFTDGRGQVRRYCPAEGHEANAKRRFGVTSLADQLGDPCYFCKRMGPVLNGTYTRIDFGASGVRNVCDDCSEKADQVDEGDES